jgi:hypothetical protein
MKKNTTLNHSSESGWSVVRRIKTENGVVVALLLLNKKLRFLTKRKKTCMQSIRGASSTSG